MGVKGIVRFLVTGFYSGYARKAPGTWGTLFATCLCVALNFAFPALFEGWGGWTLALAVTVLAIVLSELALRWELFGAGVKDPQKITMDEFAGFFCAVAGHSFSLTLVVMAFILFRLFDISKFFPGKLVEKLPGGYGVVLDDVVAGLYANVILFLIVRLSA